MTNVGFSKDWCMKMAALEGDSEIGAGGLLECHCGKDGHALNSINCPVHGSEAFIKHMVDRFLQWKLPEDFHPDGGIRFERLTYGGNVRHDPSGTNLLTATQADAMVRYMLGGTPRS